MSPLRLVLWVLLLALTTSCVQTPGPEATGREIYTDLCARCHGEDLGGGVGPPLGPGSMAAERSDEYLRTTIVRGRGSMPGFGNTLTEAQVDAVIGFLRKQQSG